MLFVNSSLYLTHLTHYFMDLVISSSFPFGLFLTPGWFSHISRWMTLCEAMTEQASLNRSSISEHPKFDRIWIIWGLILVWPERHGASLASDATGEMQKCLRVERQRGIQRLRQGTCWTMHLKSQICLRIWTGSICSAYGSRIHSLILHGPPLLSCLKV